MQGFHLILIRFVSFHVLCSAEIVDAREFTKQHSGRVFIFGVAAGNSSSNASWDVYKVYGLIDMQGFRNQHLACCFKYTLKNESVYNRVPSQRIFITHSKQRVRAFHVTCSAVDMKSGLVLNGVGLTTDMLTCFKNDVQYVNPVYPLQQNKPMLAINIQIAYGKLKAELIIEWMEAYKYLGIDKVMIYYIDNLNEDALKTLQYYSQEGYLDLHHYRPALSDFFQSNLSQMVQQTLQDPDPCHTWLLNFDAFERTSGYTYVGIIDFDEFLIPSNNRTIKQLLADLYERYPTAAGFVFQTLLYSLSWEPVNNDTDLIINSYANRTARRPGMNRRKNIYMPKYIRDGGVRIHYPIINPEIGKKMIVAPVEDGYLRHFRKCTTVGKKQLGCPEDKNRKMDTAVIQWSSCIKDNVYKVRKRIFGTRNIV